MLISFFGIVSSTTCGPPSNLNFMNFIWEHSECLSFTKYALLLFPSNYRHSPLMFLKYYRANSDGWTDIVGCGLCIENYQRSIDPITIVCVLTPVTVISVRSSLTSYTFRHPKFFSDAFLTSNALKWLVILPTASMFAVESERVDDLRLLPLPRFPSLEVRFRFKTLKKRFHLHCPDRGAWNTRMEGVFDDIKTAISLLVTNERFFGVNIVTGDSSSRPTANIRSISKRRCLLTGNSHVTHPSCRGHHRIHRKLAYTNYRITLLWDTWSCVAGESDCLLLREWCFVYHGTSVLPRV
jgi:hypothetical protein